MTSSAGTTTADPESANALISVQVDAALERIAHRMLVQRDWTDDRGELAAAR